MLIRIYMSISRDELTDMIRLGRKIVLVKNRVYDVSDFQHPFSLDPFYNKIGKDCYKDYKQHGKFAREMWKKYEIGVLKEESEMCIIM